MNILVADTSTEVLSIALFTENTYEERLVDGNFSHSENLLPEIEELLKRAGIGMKDLELLIVSKGPGSFTGLRIGKAFHQPYPFLLYLFQRWMPSLKLSGYTQVL